MTGEEMERKAGGRSCRIIEALVRNLYFILSVMRAIECETDNEIKTRNKEKPTAQTTG